LVCISEKREIVFEISSQHENVEIVNETNENFVNADSEIETVVLEGIYYLYTCIYINIF